MACAAALTATAAHSTSVPGGPVAITALNADPLRPGEIPQVQRGLPTIVTVGVDASAGVTHLTAAVDHDEDHAVPVAADGTATLVFRETGRAGLSVFARDAEGEDFTADSRTVFVTRGAAAGFVEHTGAVHWRVGVRSKGRFDAVRARSARAGLTATSARPGGSPDERREDGE